MFIETVTVSLLTGKARKGRIKNLENVCIRAWYLIFISILIEAVPNILDLFHIKTIDLFLHRYFIYLHFISYILMFIVLILNIGKRYMKLIFIGTLANFAVIFANNGQMPVSVQGLKATGQYERVEANGGHLDMSHTLIDESTRLSFLGDVIILPKPYPLAKVISMGDVFVAAGVFLLLQEGMAGEDSTKKDPTQPMYNS